jgi:hypothetical protein
MWSLEEIFRRHEAGELFTPDSIVATRKYVEVKGIKL